MTGLFIFLMRDICISPNVGRYYGLVTGPPPPPPPMEVTMEAMEAEATMEAAATERFRRLFVTYEI